MILSCTRRCAAQGLGLGVFVSISSASFHVDISTPTASSWIKHCEVTGHIADSVFPGRLPLPLRRGAFRCPTTCQHDSTRDGLHT